MDTPAVEPGSASHEAVPAAGQPPVPVSPLPAPEAAISWLWYVLALIAVIGVGAGGYLMLPKMASEQPVVKKEPVVIGGILPLSGDAASFGVPIRQAAELAQREINGAGGIGGRMIEFRFEDGMCEASQASVAAETLLSQGDIQYLIAGACSSEFLAAAPIAQSRNIISFSSSATSPDISALGPLVFRTAPSDAFAGDVAARYAREGLSAGTAAIVTEDTEYSQGLRQVFSQSFPQLGGTILIDEVFPTGTTDFSRIVEKLKATPVDVIYVLPQSPTPGILLIKALKEANVDADILTAEVLLIRDAIAEQGEILEGVTGIERFLDEQNPKLVAFLAQFKSEFGDDAPYPLDVAGVYDFLYMLKEAIEATDGSTQQVAEFLYAAEGWLGTLGPLSFDEHGDVDASYNITKIQNREIRVLDVYTGTGQ